MNRYVLRYTGEGPVPSDDLAEVREQATVVDEHGRTLLVEAPQSRVRTLAARLPRWIVTPEAVVALPPIRPGVPVAAAPKRPRRRSA